MTSPIPTPYDANGNILSVSNGPHTTTYVYDAANQLVRENNQAGGFTHVWTYDDAGNILTRTEYAYTTGTLGTATDTVNYTYGDSSWGDLLTAYDGVAISHDDIGNPLTDGTWTYTWEHGRELLPQRDCLLRTVFWKKTCHSLIIYALPSGIELKSWIRTRTEYNTLHIQLPPEL